MFISSFILCSIIAQFELSPETHDKMMGYFIIINNIGFMGASMACVTITDWNSKCIFLYRILYQF